MMPSRPALSVVVPMFNVETKIGPCLVSLAELHDLLDLEVIFVDDRSTDGSVALVKTHLEHFPAWSIVSTPAQSGSPSLPRNFGMRRARGDWIFFLDGDDAVHPGNIQAALASAQELALDIVRGPVEVHHPAERTFLVDRIPESERSGHLVNAEAVAKHQSLTCSSLYRADFLHNTGVEFDTSVRMGEDLAFTAQVLCAAKRVGYVDRPLFRYIKRSSGPASAMNSMGTREAIELARNWQVAEDSFKRRGSSYIALHGYSTISYALRQFIRHPAGVVSPEGFNALATFVDNNRVEISRLPFSPRIQPVVTALLERSYERYLEELKPRMLIAGHDLKFILGAVEALSEHFTIRVDEWPSEREHNPSASAALAEWADLVWCEWLTQCAVWYSHHIQGDRRLVTRLHRYELGRTYGEQLNLQRVNAVITIAPHCYEDAIARFGYSRELVRYIPNFYAEGTYRHADADDNDRWFRLAMIGIAPRRKGFIRALHLLNQLRQLDTRYTLTVMGSRPSEYPWIANDPAERAYYAACDEYISAHGLDESVKYLGWVDTREVVKDYGTVLSMSDGEGSHMGPGEAFLAGNTAAVLRWRGAEYIYPERYVYDSISDMAQDINARAQADRNSNVAETASHYGMDHFGTTFSLQQFVTRVLGLWNEIAR